VPSTNTCTSLLVPNNVLTAPVVYLYSFTTIFQFALLLDKTCNVNDQLPAGNDVTLGTPLSVANVVKIPLAPEASVMLVVVCALPLGVGLNCLYVGVPKALLVLVEKFM
jgi:hypothetical protein